MWELGKGSRSALTRVARHSQRGAAVQLGAHVTHTREVGGRWVVVLVWVEQQVAVPFPSDEIARRTHRNGALPEVAAVDAVDPIARAECKADCERGQAYGLNAGAGDGNWGS